MVEVLSWSNSLITILHSQLSILQCAPVGIIHCGYTLEIGPLHCRALYLFVLESLS